MDAKLLAALAVRTPEEEAILRGGTLQKELYTDGKPFVIDHSKLIGQGKTVAVRAHTRFVNFPAHRHSYVEVMYVCGGEIEHTVNGREKILLRAGELLFLNPYASHAIRRAGEHDLAVNFMILPQFFDRALPFLANENLLTEFLFGCLQNLEGNVSFLHFRVAEVLPVQNLVENLIDGLQNPQANQYELNQMTMTLLLLHLSRFLNLTHPAEELRRGSALTEAALREIEENYAAADLTALAARHGVSVSYCSQRIRKDTGRTFKELLLRKRLSQAESMLLHTRIPVQDIAHAVGYENTAYFHRAFRARFGCTPAEYRAQGRGGEMAKQ